jgi:hypothetical protein
VADVLVAEVKLAREAEAWLANISTLATECAADILLITLDCACVKTLLLIEASEAADALPIDAAEELLAEAAEALLTDAAEADDEEAGDNSHAPSCRLALKFAGGCIFSGLLRGAGHTSC